MSRQSVIQVAYVRLCLSVEKISPLLKVSLGGNMKNKLDDFSSRLSISPLKSLFYSCSDELRRVSFADEDF